MATIAQINANIGNSKFSTGPRTLEGKQASSRNSLRHGLYASLDALPAEDKQQVDEILSHFSEQFPQPEAEQQLHELALAWFRRDRVRAMQAAFLDLQLAIARQQSQDIPVSRDQLLASILVCDAAGKRNLDRLHRWDRAYSRDIDRALKALTALPQPEPAEPAAETAKTNPIPIPSPNKPTLNGPCPCGSGRKFKRCCGVQARHAAH
jgi:hypothetical protein